MRLLLLQRLASASSSCSSRASPSVLLPASKSLFFNPLESFSSSATMSGNKRVFFDVEAGGEKLGKIVMEVSEILELLI